MERTEMICKELICKDVTSPHSVGERHGKAEDLPARPLSAVLLMVTF